MNTYISSTLLFQVGRNNVLMKGNDFVDLMPGFLANAGNLFKAYVGPCGSGGVQFVPSINDELPLQGVFMNAENGKRWPYARLKNVNMKTASTIIGIETAGDYSLRITDENGKLLSVVFVDKAFSRGDHEYSYAPFLPTIRNVLSALFKV